ncbi:MAG: hypothetical protein K8F36_03370 [Melioribacteraceae bacterium]|nr:hypothetical protein [Melioribacteraceae bacterium]
MKDRFIYLLETYFENQLKPEELKEFNKLLDSDPVLKNEFEQQKRVKEVLKKMSLKNPSSEVWDNYWTIRHNRIERFVSWFLFIAGAMFLVGYGIVKGVESFIADDHSPFILKFGIAVFVIGLLLLGFSILREKLTIAKSDKYKEIQR